MGDLYLTDKIGAPEFTAEDQQVIELLATHAGIAIHNAQLYAREQHAHQLLQEQTAKLREQAQLIELAHDAILVRDLESRVVQWNGGAVETYGWTAEEARGQVTHTLLQTRFPASLQEVEAALQERGQWDGELEHARRDGTRIAVESRHVLLGDADGQPTAILEINREITQRKRAEAALRLLAASGTLLESTLDEEAVLGALARLAVPALGDWCSVFLRDAEDADTLRRRVVAHVGTAAPEPALVSLRDQLYPVDLAAERGIGAVLRTGQPERVAVVAEADLAAVAEDAAHLLQVRARGIVSYLLIPLAVQGQRLGVLTVSAAASGRHYTPEDLALAEDLARRAALALANARLHRQMQALTTLRERERIGRDLHDSVIQDLYALTLQLELVAADLADAGAQARLHDLGDLARRVMGDIRAYVRGLPAQALQEQPLAEALGRLVQEVEQGSALAVTYLVMGQPVPMPLERATMLLQITREALSNVLKHAQARQAAVRLVFGAEHVELTIRDDGQGFDSEAVQGAEHLGLRNVRSRTADAGGSLSVQRTPGAGTTLQVRLPV